MREHSRPGGRTVRSNITILIGFLVAALALLGTAPAAATAGGGGGHPARRAAVHGYVLGINDDPSNAMNGPLAGATVSVVDARTGKVLGSGTTDVGGEYLVTGLPAGKVKIHATMAGFLPVWGADRPTFRTADVYRLAPGRTLGIERELVLRAEAVISGQVLGHFDPVSYATVTVFDADTGRVLRSQVTDGSGYYTVDGLPARNIKVRASLDGWIPNWASHKPTWATADVYTLHAGQHLSQTWDAAMILYLDMSLPVTIRGWVLGQSQPLAHSRVAVLDADTGKTLRRTVTDQAGHYEVTGMAPGRIKVRATKPGWNDGYANNKTTLETADVFTLWGGWVLDQANDPSVLLLDLTRRSDH